jgi:hypothetical protein
MPSQITEFEDKLPAALDPMLRKLYVVREALRRRGFVEAIKHLGDLSVLIQNEIDWCYRTDRVLPYMLETTMRLTDVTGSLLKVPPGTSAQAIPAIIEVLDELATELEKHMLKVPEWQAPETTLDHLEKQHRARTYFGK